MLVKLRVMDNLNTNLRLFYNGPSGVTAMQMSGNGRTIFNGLVNVNAATCSVTNTGEARYHLYNNGSVSEWLLGQKNSNAHNFVISRRVGTDEFNSLGINANGDIGIGTDTPIAKLDVNGNMKCSGNSYIQGNVGIGTTNPQVALDVVGDIQGNRLSSKGSANSIEGGELILVNPGQPNNGAGWIMDNYDSNLRLFHSSTNAESMRMYPNGNIELNGHTSINRVINTPRLIAFQTIDGVNGILSNLHRNNADGLALFEKYYNASNNKYVYFFYNSTYFRFLFNGQFNPAISGINDLQRTFDRGATWELVPATGVFPVSGATDPTGFEIGVLEVASPIETAFIRNNLLRPIVDVTDNDVKFNGSISAGNMGWRNRIINGNMNVNRRLVDTTTTSIVNANGLGIFNMYQVDRWKLNHKQTGGGAVTGNRVNLSSADQPFRAGHQKSLRFTTGTTVPVYEYIEPVQVVEQCNMGDFNYGTVNGRNVSVSFWIKANVAAGSKLIVALRNFNANNVYYVYNHEFTVVASDAWQYVTANNIPPPPINSSWITATGAGIEVFICPCHSNGHITTTFSWQNSFSMNTAGSTRWCDTPNTYIEFTGVQLEKGPIATPFDLRPHPIEQRLCRRYYQNMDVRFYGSSGLAGQALSAMYSFPVEFRDIPILTYVDLVANNASIILVRNQSVTNFAYHANVLETNEFETARFIVADADF